MPTTARAVDKIKKAGILLVFPIKGKPGLPSLWSAFYPDAQMNWDWTDEADERVARLWHLRTELSTCRDAAYSKWFKDRATCFSIEIFTALLSLVSGRDPAHLNLSVEAESILRALGDDSPLPTKELKIRSDLLGKENNSAFDRAMKELWRRFLIVGHGEVEEGGYPSLAVGSSKLLFEDEWEASRSISDAERRQTLLKYYSARHEFYGQYLRIEREILSTAENPYGGT